MKYISYCTEGVYEEVMNTYLRPSLEKHNLDYYIETVPDLGSWQKNTAFKAEFIKKCLLEFKEDVVFIDADGEVLVTPDLFYEIDEECDIAVHYLDWFLHWRNQKGGKKFELLSGTMLIRYNETVMNIMDQYIESAKNNLHVLEQKILEDIISNTPNINVYNLPPEYCTVILRYGKLPKYIQYPVILHNQASREFKRRKK